MPHFLQGKKWERENEISSELETKRSWLVGWLVGGGSQFVFSHVKTINFFIQMHLNSLLPSATRVLLLLTILATSTSGCTNSFVGYIYKEFTVNSFVHSFTLVSWLISNFDLYLGYTIGFGTSKHWICPLQIWASSRWHLRLHCSQGLFRFWTSWLKHFTFTILVTIFF